jgi:ELWxxDGT repeat protein
MSFSNALGPGGATVFFAADDGVHGNDLWRTDGTLAGTALVKDVNPSLRSDASTNLDGASELNGKLLFYANDGVHGYEPWITDGTESGTRMIADTDPRETVSNYGSRFVPAGHQCFFTAYDQPHGLELWVTDGTETGTHLVRDINPGVIWSNASPGVSMGPTLFFTANDGVHGSEVWVSDGTESGTRMLLDLTLGPGSSYVHGFTRFGNDTYFITSTFADDDAPTLWRSDGTAGGTVPIPLKGGLAFETGIVVWKDALWLLGSSYDPSTPSELWRSDGTVGGTGRVGSIEAEWTYEREVAGGFLYFLAYDDARGYEVWVTDGTPDGAHLLRDVRPGPLSSDPAELTPVGGTVYFTANDGTHGTEIWKSDGTEAGTALVTDIEPGRFSSLPSQLVDVEGILLFSAGLDDKGLELWRSDGTPEGTYLLQDLLPGPAYSYPRHITTFGNRVLLSAIDDLAGREPWIGRAAIVTQQPLRAVQDLADDVRALDLPPALEQSLLAKLTLAGNALARPNGYRAALGSLDAFARLVESKTPDPISEASSADLLDFEGQIERLLLAAEAATPTLPRAVTPAEDWRMTVKRGQL